MTIDERKLGKFLIEISCFAALLLGPACAHSAPPQPESATLAQAASAPDAAKARKHLHEHVQYPASRAQVLAACAQTPEFSASEKRWLSDTLPDRTYASADEVVQALGI